MGGSGPVGPGSVCGEQDARSVVGEVPKSVGEASGLLDDEVDGLGSAVVDAAGGEVGQDLVLPLPQGPAQPCDFWDGAGVEGVDDLLGEPSSALR